MSASHIDLLKQHDLEDLMEQRPDCPLSKFIKKRYGERSKRNALLLFFCIEWIGQQHKRRKGWASRSDIREVFLKDQPLERKHFDGRPIDLCEKQLYRLLEYMEEAEIITRNKKGRPLYKCRKDVFVQPRKEKGGKLSSLDEISLLHLKLKVAKSLMAAGGPYPDPDQAINFGVSEEEDVLWFDRFIKYGESMGAKSGQWLSFEGSIAEWTSPDEFKDAGEPNKREKRQGSDRTSEKLRGRPPRS